MAWENFWKLDDKGRRLTHGPQLAAFRNHFPERVVEPKPAIERPLIIVLEKPYRLSRFPAADIYEHKPVLLRELKGWPPSLSLSRFGHFPRPGDGDLLSAKVVQPERVGGDAVLVIKGEFDDQQVACTIVGYPAIFLECVARTLNEHAGEEFRSLSDLELTGID
jgi:hypothetical protein